MAIGQRMHSVGTKRRSVPGPKIRDIAQLAGVSTATVDRVLHGRGGVAPARLRAVQRAAAALRGRIESGLSPRRFLAILPRGAGSAIDNLAEELEKAADHQGAQIERCVVAQLDPFMLARALLRVDPARYQGVALMPLEHVEVHQAIEQLIGRGVSVLSLTTSLAHATPATCVGMDNRTAGKTAGRLMGRFLRGSAKVVVLWNGHLDRGDEDREQGFRSLLRQEFTGLQVRELVVGSNDSGNESALLALLQQEPELTGIYSVGGSHIGVARALKQAARARDITWIGHDLTDDTRNLLLDGTMDAVVHQDLPQLAHQAIKALVNPDHDRPGPLPVRITLRENLPARHIPGQTQSTQALSELCGRKSAPDKWASD